jgi:hypothetical protein
LGTLIEQLRKIIEREKIGVFAGSGLILSPLSLSPIPPTTEAICRLQMPSAVRGKKTAETIS